jgi:hypothetical protein
MTETKPDLSNRVEASLLRVFREAFDGLPVFSFSDPGEQSGACIGIKTELGAEEPIGTNIFNVAIEVEARNLEPEQLQLLTDLIGNAHAGRDTIALYGAKQFVMPKGQPVEMAGAPRSVEDENERIITYSLTASIQPI